MADPTANHGRFAPGVAAGPFRLREIRYPAGLRQPRHAHDACGITLVVAGVIRERAGSTEEIASALSIVVKPAGVEHSDDMGPRGARTLQIAFEPDWARRFEEGGVDIGQWRWLHGRCAAAGFLAVLRSLSGTSALELEDLVLEAVSAIPCREANDRVPPPWLGRVVESLQDEPVGRSTVRELADEVGAHPVTVSRAFKAHYGCTISEYRRRVRLRRAAASIDEASRSLSRVAHAAGYADHAHLCREFRESTGLTPSEFRRLTEHG
ncbi:MAG: AraC family transcriptional regulator [Longimicrobiales bacterium]